MHVIDSHTEGEPTRVILDGGPDLGSGPLAKRAERLASQYADFCASVILEPRGREALVGALLVEPTDRSCETGVIYFNAAAPLGMCGHATIGLAATLAHLDRIGKGTHRIETPVGIVEVDLKSATEVMVTNVESYRLSKAVTVDVEGFGKITGDVAYGGNWFFLVKNSPIAVRPGNIQPLMALSKAIRDALVAAKITGRNGAYIDHVELFGEPRRADARSSNFVLCPDGAYDRSPCGTGCSAKLACLAADGMLAPGEDWVQESVIGSSYRLNYQPGPNGGIIPTVTGTAFVTAETRLHFDPDDPFKAGIVLENC